MTEAERDESLRLFGHRPAEQEEARRWLQPWRRDTKRKPPEIKDLPVYDKVFQKLVEAMPIEKRLAEVQEQEQVRKRLQGAAHGGPRHLGPPEVRPLAPVFCFHPTLTAPPFGFR